MKSCRFVIKTVISLLAGFAAAMTLRAQNPTPDEKWNVYFQSTSIGQYHPGFAS